MCTVKNNEYKLVFILVKHICHILSFHTVTNFESRFIIHVMLMYITETFHFVRTATVVVLRPYNNHGEIVSQILNLDDNTLLIIRCASHNMLCILISV